ncbi:hypothetical protein L1987_71104 [Smallanthus sonchifolius]|uniref:Uncharacterized protein n=1 Tax=Smallanthus sonchifolius TaxID=185202 RepID=A0ACB9AS56_9ASTR|nr:hypothetical protein L1987_71104 [Smallanthus sonchifolius]
MELATIFLLVFGLRFFPKSFAIELNNISDSRFLIDGDTLVSDTGIFELGFFPSGSSESRYLGIRYKKISVSTLVWVANREQPLDSTSALVLKIMEPGILVLFKNMSMIWSSNKTMESRNATAKLHDTGNLVLMDLDEKVLWQSFDYPTEHWLPGMKIGSDYSRGIEWHLSSWKSSQHPVVGEFTWGADIHGYPESKLKQGTRVILRGEPWRNQRFSRISEFNGNLTVTYNVIINQQEASFAYNLENSSTMSRITLSFSGKLESWMWVEAGMNWQLGASFSQDVCDTYNICSAYGSCIHNMTQQSCVCFDETRFVPRSKRGWEMADWSGGCVRRTQLECKNGSEIFIKYSNVKLPDTQSSWYNRSMNMQECEVECLKNCTCMAYANPDTGLGGRGCLLWFGDLLDASFLHGCGMRGKTRIKLNQ